MRTRLLGGSGLRVSDLCLGTMTFGTDWGWGADEATCGRIYDAYREAGGNFVDTANLYTGGSSEEILGRLVASERDAMVLATKYTMPTTPNDPNASGSHRKSLRRSVETSLRRLGTDHLDLLWVHAWDECTPAEETLRALDDLVRGGKVLAIGVSNTPAWVVARSTAIAELRGWSSFCALQVEYSLVERSADRELLPMGTSLGLAMSAWSPLAGGVLSGKFSEGEGADTRRGSGRDGLRSEQEAAMRAVDEVAEELGTSPARVAIAWVLQRGLIPLLGARTQAQIEDNLGATEVVLAEPQLERLDSATRVDLGQPHGFLRERRAAISGGVLSDG